MEDDFTNGRLAASSETHEENRSISRFRGFHGESGGDGV